MPIQALIFDFDGLILDTETPEFLTWQSIYRRYGAEMSQEEWLACVGTTQDAFNPLANLQQRTREVIHPERILAELHARSNQQIYQQAVMPGVMDYLEAAKTLKLKLAVATSSTSDWVVSHLRRLDIYHYFESVCSAESVERVKPDPALYLCAVNALGVRPDQAVAFEDSLNGLLSAKRAGLFCVVIPNMVTRKLDFASADLVLGSLSDAPLSELLARLNGHA